MMTAETAPRPDFSLVFVNFRSGSQLAEALDGLFSQEPGEPSFEVVVVNNDPAESAILSDLQERHGFCLIESESNVGFARAANRGADLARGATIGFLNPDIRWDGKKLPAVKWLLDENAEAGIVGLSLHTAMGSPERFSFGSDPSLVNIFLKYAVENLYRFRLAEAARHQKRALSVERVSGGALFIRSGLFRALGDFDEAYFLYFEDADLCLRAREYGAIVLQATGISLTHLGGASRLSVGEQKRAYFRSQDVYFGKHRSPLEVFLLRWLRWARYGI